MTPAWIGPNGQRAERLELHLSYQCPQRCLFCSEAHSLATYRACHPVTARQVADVLRRHARHGVRMLHLTGGEPTCYPDLVAVTRAARDLGMRVALGTNGSALAEHGEVAALVDEVVFSLHGPSSDVHDLLTRAPGSLNRVTEAMEAWAASHPRVRRFVNTVVTRPSLSRLLDTVALACELGAEQIVISNLSPEGAGLDNYEQLAVPLDQLADVLPRVPAAAGDRVVRFFAVPICLLGSHAMLSNDLHWDPRVTVEWSGDPAQPVFEEVFSWKPDRGRTHPPVCEPCSYKSMCMGVFTEYAARWPTESLSPI